MLREEDVSDYAIYAEAVQLRRRLLAGQGLLASEGGGGSIAAAAGLTDGMFPEPTAAKAALVRNAKRHKRDDGRVGSKDSELSTEHDGDGEW
jgi:hypothetical protein